MVCGTCGASARARAHLFIESFAQKKNGEKSSAKMINGKKDHITAHSDARKKSFQWKFRFSWFFLVEFKAREKSPR